MYLNYFNPQQIFYWYKDVPKRIARAKETKASISATNI